MSPSSGPQHQGRRVVLTLFVLIALFVGVRFVLRRNRPERLLSLPQNNLVSYAVINGQLYLITTREGRTRIAGRQHVVTNEVVSTLPITGGAARVLVTEPSDWQIDLIFGPSRSPFAAYDKALFYLLEPVLQQTATGMSLVGSGVGGTVVKQVPMRYLGDFLLVKPASSPPNAKRRAVRYFETPAPARLCRLDVGEGKVRTMLSTSDSPFVGPGNVLYLIHRQPDERIQVVIGNEEHDEVRGHSDLMTMPLSGGQARKLATGLSESDPVFAGEEGVYWTRLHAYPDTRVDLFYSRPQDKAAQQVAVNQERLPPLVELHGRFYSIGSRETTDSQPGEESLMVRNRDGSQPRLVFSLSSHRQGFIQMLRTDAGGLYFLSSDQISSSEKPGRTYLYRIHPERNDAVELVRDFTQEMRDFRLDRNYLYFIKPELPWNFWIWLGGGDARIQPVSVLYRVSLPSGN